jgi:hypothetical protein
MGEAVAVGERHLRDHARQRFGHVIERVVIVVENHNPPEASHAAAGTA